MKREQPSPYWTPHMMRATDRLEDADEILLRDLTEVYEAELFNWNFFVTVLVLTAFDLGMIWLVIHEWPLIKALWSMR